MGTTVLPTSENSRLLGGKDAPYVFQCTLSIEIFRFAAFVAIISLFAVGTIVSNLFVFAPEEPGGTFLGMVSKGTRDVTDTRIYEIFGFNHLCNVVDFNPSKVCECELLCEATLFPNVHMSQTFFRPHTYTYYRK
jgi:hypothetical protein